MLPLITNNKLHLSMLEALLITKFQPVLGIQKQFYIFLLFNTTVLNSTNSNLVWEEKKLSLPILLVYGEFFFFWLSLLPPRLFDSHYPCLFPHYYLSVMINFSDEMWLKGRVPFFRILKCYILTFDPAQKYYSKVIHRKEVTHSNGQ